MTRTIVTLLMVFSLPALIFGQRGRDRNNDNGNLGPEKKVERDVLFVKAATQKMLGDYEQALVLYDQALGLDPSHHASHYEKARIYLQKKEFPQAIQAAETALKGDPANYWYRQQLREIYLEQGAFEKAIEVGEELIKEHPDRPEDRRILAELYEKTDQNKAAIRCLEDLSERKGGDVAALERIIALQQKENDWDDALKTARKLTELAPYSPVGYEQQAACLEALGRPEEVSALARSWIKQSPDNVRARLLLAAHAEPSEQIDLLEPVFLSSEVALEQKLKALDQLGDKATASQRLDLLEILKAEYGAHPEVEAREADLYFANGDYAQSAVALRRSLRASPANEPYWEKLLFADLAQPDLPALKRDVEEARELYPNSRNLLAYYALLGIRTGDAELASYAMEKIAKRGLENTDVQLAAFAAWKQQAPEQAQSVELPQTDFFKNLNAAYATAKEGKSSGKTQEAFAALLQSNRLLSVDPMFWTLYGHAASQAGDAAQAASCWEKAKRYGMENPETAF